MSQELPTHTIMREVVTVQHRIDASRIKTLADVRAIFKTMTLLVWDDGSERFEPVRHLYADSVPEGLADGS